jgi:hypothetical protein
MKMISKKIVASGLAALLLGGTIAASTVPAAADSGSTIAAGILGATAGAMFGAAAASAAPPPPPVVYAPGPRCWMERRPVLDPYGYVVGYRPARVCEESHEIGPPRENTGGGPHCLR